MASPISKATRWHKKQVLDRSDKALKASLQEQGHVFRTKKAESISAAMRCASVKITAGVTENGYGLTDRVQGTPAMLGLMGFLPLGGGFMKLGHSTWKLEAADGGDVTVSRLEDETVKAATFPKRRTSRMDSALAGLGYPLALQERMSLTEKMAVQKSGEYFDPVGVELSIRGLPARIARVWDHEHFAIRFEGSGIMCLQKIARCLDEDANSRLAALQESAQAMIATGEFSRQARVKMAEEVSSDESLTKDDVAGFIAAMDGAVAESLQARMTQCEQGPRTGSEHSAQGGWVLESNGAWTRHEGDLHGMVWEVEDAGWDWDLFQDLHDVVASGNAESDEAAKAACDQAMSGRGKTAQSVQKWSEFNGAHVCDFSPTHHGMIERNDDDSGKSDWKLYEAGKVADAGTASSLEEAQEHCAIAAAESQDPGVTARTAQARSEAEAIYKSPAFQKRINDACGMYPDYNDIGSEDHDLVIDETLQQYEMSEGPLSDEVRDELNDMISGGIA